MLTAVRAYAVIRAVVIVIVGIIGGIAVMFPVIYLAVGLGNSGYSDATPAWSVATAWFLAKEIGPVAGGTLFPIGYYRFLRRVPPVSALAGSAGGAALGGVIGAMMMGPAYLPLSALGFFAACVWLTHHYRIRS